MKERTFKCSQQKNGKKVRTAELSEKEVDFGGGSSAQMHNYVLVDEQQPAIAVVKDIFNTGMDVEQHASLHIESDDIKCSPIVPEKLCPTPIANQRVNKGPFKASEGLVTSMRNSLGENNERIQAASENGNKSNALIADHARGSAYSLSTVENNLNTIEPRMQQPRGTSIVSTLTSKHIEELANELLNMKGNHTKPATRHVDHQRKIGASKSRTCGTVPLHPGNKPAKSVT